MGRWVGVFVIAISGASFVAFGPECGAQTTTILGCSERLAAEIGVREFVGNVGDTLRVGITIHTSNSVDAFGFQLDYPESLVSYVGLENGNLTVGFTQLSAADSGDHLTIAGFSLNPDIPAGQVGTLAFVKFRADSAGQDQFRTQAYVDDIAGYIPCEAIHTPSPVAPTTWGRIKSLYSPLFAEDQEESATGR